MRNDRIKLLEFITFFGIGGTERQVLNLAQGLDPERFELSFGCMHRRGPLLDEVETSGIPISEYQIPSFLHYRTIPGQLRLARYLRRNRIDVVHSYGFYSNVFAVPAARLAGVPLIVASIRDTGELLTPMKKRVQKLACRLADCVLANADAVRDWLVAEGYNADKIHVIRNGIAHSQFAGAGPGAGLRQEFGLPAGAPLVGVLSRLNELKGVEYFLEAAAAVAPRFEDARFLIIGDGAHKAHLVRCAERLGLGGRAVFTGFRRDVPQVLSELTISVLPSLSEGLSNTLLESMAAGIPVIATTVGGNPEAVDDAGLFVAPRDSGGLAKAICRLLGNPALASQLGRAGRRRIAEKFSNERMIRDTQNFYEEMLRRRTGRRTSAAMRAA